jgi:hypothetical protein
MINRPNAVEHAVPTGFFGGDGGDCAFCYKHAVPLGLL